MIDLSVIHSLLGEEEKLGEVNGMEDLLKRTAKRQALSQLLSAGANDLRTVQQRARQLAPLPPLSSVLQARAILAQPSLAYMEVDTTGVQQGAEIIRFLLVDAQSQVLVDLFVRPEAHVPPQISKLTGITQEQVSQSPRLPDIWSTIAEAVVGRHIVSYGLDFDKGKLHERAQELGVLPPAIIGSCLQELARQYFCLDSYVSLSDLCIRIGFPPPERSTALDRALGQMHLLSAIAHVQTGEQPPF